jgi:hypothetical protein
MHDANSVPAAAIPYVIYLSVNGIALRGVCRS